MNKDADTRHDDDCGIEDNGKPGDQMKKGAGIANDSNQEFNNEGESPTAPLDSKEQDGGEQVGVGPRRRKRKSKSKYSNMEHDNLEKMLQWKNGIGYLEGSNLKFYKTDSGTLEVMTQSEDEDENDEFVNGGGGSSNRGNHSNNHASSRVSDEDDIQHEVNFDQDGGTGKMTRRNRRGVSRQDSNNTPCSTPPLALASSSDTPRSEKGTPTTEGNKRQRKERKKNKKYADDELLKCETCGCYGLISEFRSSGRFCSQRCVGAYASKRRTLKIQEQLENGTTVVKPSPTNKKPGPVGVGTYKKKKSESKPGTPSSPSGTSKLKKQIKQEIDDDSIIYYKTIGYDTEFSWETYLRTTGSKPSPVEAFFKEYDEQEIVPAIDHDSEKFAPGMKLECVDPKHQSIICCCTVIEVLGPRLRLNFDGWNPNYDFWINANSFFLRPCGWCEKNEQKLQPPKDIPADGFDWSSYLTKTNATAAPDHLFRNQLLPPISRHGFRTTMKLEAVDRKNPDLVCVASVANTMGDQFLIHFDEWDDLYDYWCRDDNPYIHPKGWCQRLGIALVPPTDEMVGKFVWDDYLSSTSCTAAPSQIFKEPVELLFQVGDKLEVIDPRNPTLCRVATASRVEDFKLHIHFDGWPSIYDYWFDFDSTDIHPVGWCQKTGHALEPPPTNVDNKSPCGVSGCKGVGHIKGAKYTSHHTSFGCPYTMQNIHRATSPVVDRLSVDTPEAYAGSVGVKSNEVSPTSTVFPDSTTNNLKSAGKSKKVKDKNLKTNRKRKRRGSDEVSSSTSFIPTEINHKTIHEYNPTDVPKKIRSTHIPAGSYGNENNRYWSTNEKKSRAIPWGTQEVGKFLKTIGYEEFVPVFKDNQIDGQALLLLSQADLVHHLKLKLGPALKIYSEISKL